jgi:hypothetical protein
MHTGVPKLVIDADVVPPVPVCATLNVDFVM